MFIIVDNQKFCYYEDQLLTTQKGVIDFSAIKPRLTVEDETTFKIIVEVTNGQTKTFTFRTITKGSLATWITIINM